MEVVESHDADLSIASTLDTPTTRYDLGRIIEHIYLERLIDSYNQALGLQPTEEGGVTFIAKNASNTNKPAKNIRTVTYGPNTSNRK